LKDISCALGIIKLDDWYRVSHDDLSNCSAFRFLHQRGGLLKILLQMYPNHQWDIEKFSNRQKKSSQWWLCNIIKDIFSKVEVLEEYVHPFLKYRPGNAMVFDIFVPSFNMMLEYHGHQHYYDHHLFGYVKPQQERDDIKRKACQHQGITFLEVPYWWQRDKESIVTLLHKQRPDIVPT